MQNKTIKGNNKMLNAKFEYQSNIQAPIKKATFTSSGGANVQIYFDTTSVKSVVIKIGGQTATFFKEDALAILSNMVDQF